MSSVKHKKIILVSGFFSDYLKSSGDVILFFRQNIIFHECPVHRTLLITNALPAFTRTFRFFIQKLVSYLHQYPISLSKPYHLPGEIQFIFIIMPQVGFEPPIFCSRDLRLKPLSYHEQAARCCSFIIYKCWYLYPRQSTCAFLIVNSLKPQIIQCYTHLLKMRHQEVTHEISYVRGVCLNNAQRSGSALSILCRESQLHRYICTKS